MQGKKQYQEKLFLNFQMSDRVPKDNFYRRLNEIVDFKFLYKLTAKYYGSEGQKSVDPVVFMKLILVGYLENINSDRCIINMAQMRLDILFFIGYDLDEILPWHSTLSRTRKLYGQEVFTQLFKEILKQCVDKGMISGKRQAIDGVYVKANASLDSMLQREVLEDADLYLGELKANEQDDTSVVKFDKNKSINARGLKPKQNASNKTHYNASDPEARISVKKGKAMALNYLGEVSVDTASHVITHIQAFTADTIDGSCLPIVLNNVIDNLKENGIIVEEVVADTNFSCGEALRALEEKNIVGYIPSRPQFIYERPGFIYNSEGDFYTCMNNMKIPFNGIQRAGSYYNKHYKANKKNCNECSFNLQCPVYKSRNNEIRETIDRPYYVRMHERMQTPKARQMMKVRKGSVEPVIGTLVNYLSMKKLNTKGLKLANKCMTMAATAYNLKKLLKYNLLQTRADVKALEKSAERSFRNIIELLTNTINLLAAFAYK